MIRTTVFALLIFFAATQLSANTTSIDKTAGRAAAQTQPLEESAQQWADAFFSKAIELHRVTGASIAIVENERVVLQKGYGVANRATGIKVDPASTQFRVASISKTFVATAIAQLLEEGKIKSLDDPINTYLKRARLLDIDGKSVTFWDLLTHRSGFEDKLFGSAIRQLSQVPKTPEEIQAFLPRQINRPGTVISYNNQGSGLLGVLVEDISGITLAQYYEKNIFAPLGMTNTRLHTDTAIATNLAVPDMTYPNGTISASPGDWAWQPLYAGAGGIDTTAADMTRWMRAHLDAGKSSSPLKISKVGFEKLHSRHFGIHPMVSGFGMQFFEYQWNGVNVFEHSGIYPDFRSYMTLLPDRNVGIFISWSGTDAAILPSDMLQSLFGSGRLVPSQKLPRNFGRPVTLSEMRGSYMPWLIGDFVSPRSKDLSDAQQYAGTYVSARRNHSNVEKAIQLVSPEAFVNIVTAVGEHKLRINGRPYEEVSAGVFWRAPDEAQPFTGYSDTIAFIKNDSENVTGFMPFYADDTRERISSIRDNPLVLRSLLLYGIGIVATGLLLLWRRPAAKKAMLLFMPALTLLLLIAIPLLAMMAAPSGLTLTNAWAAGEIGNVALMVIFANLIAISTLATGIAMYWAWRDTWWGSGVVATIRRLHLSSVFVASCAILFSLEAVNLIGWRLP